MANFCCKCIHWEKVDLIAAESFGVCDNVSVATKVALDGKTHLGEEGTLWTEAYFGCVYWRQNDGSLLNFEDIIDDETGKVL